MRLIHRSRFLFNMQVTRGRLMDVIDSGLGIITIKRLGGRLTVTGDAAPPWVV